MITLTAKITLDNGAEIVIDKRNLHSLEQSIVDRGNIALPSWGIISNGGRIVFSDFISTDDSGQEFWAIKQLAETHKLVGGLETVIFLNDTLANTSYAFKNYITDTWDYDSNSREVSVSLTDGLQEWQDTVVDVLPFRATTPQNVDGEYIYTHWYGKTPSKFKMKDFANLDENTKTALAKFSAALFISEDTNLWSAWATFCEAVQARIYRNNKGETIFTCRD